MVLGFLLASSFLGSVYFTAAIATAISKTLEAGPLVGPIVTLDYGTLTGLVDDGNSIISFRGVRYADPPTGHLRWKAPVSPPSKHLGHINAKDFGKVCIRTTQTQVVTQTSEDCLFGNIWIPLNTHVNDKLPVMVWFHGGGFESGSTHSNTPEMLMNSSVNPLIFVSFEYRLGQFGFLGGSTVKANGDLNAGLLDQRAALRWVQRYIANFGGDPSTVTIWGQSAGAGSTMFHLIANGGNNEGLFRAAMGDSPSLSFVPSYNESYDEDIYQQFAQLAGCGKHGVSVDSLQCLRKATSNKLARAGSSLIAARTSTLYVFAPIIDGTFLAERPVEAFKAGHFAQVPVLFGSNTDDGANWSSEVANPLANTSMPNATQETVFDFINGQYASFTQHSFDDIVELYPIQEYGTFSLQGQQMYGEARYICTAAMISGAVSATKANPAYQFRYDNPHLGSDHAFDLQAFFDPPSNANSDDNTLFKAMREYWTSFVTTGTPISSSGISWEPVSDISGSPRILLHPNGITMEVLGNQNDRCLFWHGLSHELQT